MSIAYTSHAPILPCDSVAQYHQNLAAHCAYSFRLRPSWQLDLLYMRRRRPFRPPPSRYTVSSGYSGFVKQGGSPDEARLEQTPYPFQPQSLFRHKRTLYRFNQGGSYYCRGLKWVQGAEPPRSPLTLTTDR